MSGKGRAHRLNTFLKGLKCKYFLKMSTLEEVAEYESAASSVSTSSHRWTTSPWPWTADGSPYFSLQPLLAPRSVA